MRFALALALAATFVIAPRASADNSLEHQLKAAYIYNFIRFVEWPASSGTGEILVCVVGPASVQQEMKEELEGKKIGERGIRVHGAASPQDAAGCSVLYVANRSADVARRFTAAVPRDRVLTITEADGFPETGSLINFFLDNQTVHFAVNTDMLADTQFKLSSQMLQFGTMVTQKATGK